MSMRSKKRRLGEEKHINASGSPDMPHTNVIEGGNFSSLMDDAKEGSIEGTLRLRFAGDLSLGKKEDTTGHTKPMQQKSN